MPEYVTPAEAAQRLGVTRDTIRRYVDAGKLDGIKTPGGQRRIDRQSLERALNTPKGPNH
jgi:excisionase family DNA binding protein